MNRTVRTVLEFAVAGGLVGMLALASATKPQDRDIIEPGAPPPRNPLPPFEPPAQSIPQPLPGRPAPPPVEGTGRPREEKSDQRIIIELTDALLKSPGAPPVTGLGITVVGGKATLRGTVRSQRDKDEAGARARAIAGWENVTNDLVIKP